LQEANCVQAITVNIDVSCILEMLETGKYCLEFSVIDFLIPYGAVANTDRVVSHNHCCLSGCVFVFATVSVHIHGVLVDGVCHTCCRRFFHNPFSSVCRYFVSPTIVHIGVNGCGCINLQKVELFGGYGSVV